MSLGIILVLFVLVQLFNLLPVHELKTLQHHYFLIEIHKCGLIVQKENVKGDRTTENSSSV